MNYKPLGKTGLKVPPIIFGTSCLGNLYQALPDQTKLQILKEMFIHVDGPVVLDSAGKYGAGLSLEVIGKSLKELGIVSNRVLISNKLGWYRVPLTTPEPTFEPGAWMGLEHDAVQKISYDSILECWEQGCELLGNDYKPQMVSVHDPDEYLAQANNEDERKKVLEDITGAYRALIELKNQGQTQAVGIGAKDWTVIRDISREIKLDWVMLAVSFTIFRHPPELLAFIDELTDNHIGIINSAVFHTGFFTGGNYFDYRVLDPTENEDKPYFLWRDNFFDLCNRFDVLPADACVQFGISHPSVISIALNTSKPERIQQNVASAEAEIPNDFWIALKDEGLISKEYPYVG